MSTKLSVWIDNPTNENTQDAMTFAADSQRASGFVTGTPASSKRINTALRQANLVAVALMDLIAPNSDVTAQSSLTQMKSAIQAYLSNLATKSDVDASKVTTKQVVIYDEDWMLTGDGNMYASIVVQGIQSANAVLVDVDILEMVKSGYTNVQRNVEQWSRIYACEAGQNELKFYISGTMVPELDFYVNVMVVT